MLKHNESVKQQTNVNEFFTAMCRLKIPLFTAKMTFSMYMCLAPLALKFFCNARKTKKKKNNFYHMMDLSGKQQKPQKCLKQENKKGKNNNKRILWTTRRKSKRKMKTTTKTTMSMANIPSP